MDSIHQTRLAQSVEHQTLNRRVVGSNPTVDKNFFILYFVASDALLAGRLTPCKWNQAWRPSELYMCIERVKVDFKSREVNCLKECALALSYFVTSTNWLICYWVFILINCCIVNSCCRMAGQQCTLPQITVIRKSFRCWLTLVLISMFGTR